MSDPQIGVQIGEIHNENTGGGNVQNSTASVPGSGYPLVSLSLLFIQLVCVFFQWTCLIWSWSTQKNSTFIFFSNEHFTCTILRFMHTLLDFSTFWTIVINGIYMCFLSLLYFFWAFIGITVKRTIHITVMTQHRHHHLWTLGHWTCTIQHLQMGQVTKIQLKPHQDHPAQQVPQSQANKCQATICVTFNPNLMFHMELAL